MVSSTVYPSPSRAVVCMLIFFLLVLIVLLLLVVIRQVLASIANSSSSSRSSGRTTIHCIPLRFCLLYVVKLIEIMEATRYSIFFASAFDDLPTGIRE